MAGGCWLGWCQRWLSFYLGGPLEVAILIALVSGYASRLTTLSTLPINKCGGETLTPILPFPYTVPLFLIIFLARIFSIIFREHLYLQTSAFHIQ